MDRMSDADRMLRRATDMLEDRVADGGSVEQKQLARAAMAATAICEATRDPTWAGWVARFYGRAAVPPPADVVEELGTLLAVHPGLRQPIDEMVTALSSKRELGAADAAALARLRGSS
jgi:hypothetical protein